MTLTLAQARTILDKTLAAAREKKLKPLGVAVVDNRGALRTYAEEDGSPILRSRIASGKGATTRRAAQRTECVKASSLREERPIPRTSTEPWSLRSPRLLASKASASLRRSVRPRRAPV